MIPGDAFTTRILKPRNDDANGNLRSEVTYRPPEGETFVAIVIGSMPFPDAADDEKFQAFVEAQLRSFGWSRQ